jgi:hypothetical protein
VTRSFVRVKENFARLLDYALAEFVPHSQRVRPGDIVYLNQHGTDLADIDHTQIISKVVDNRAFVSQHSPGYTKSFQAVVQSFKQRGSILGRDWQYWVLRPKYTATNLTS